MKIGIMGGTFDPIHNGHVTLAENALSHFSLDKIWFLPNGNPPHKGNENILSPLVDRITMVRLAIENKGDFSFCDYEATNDRVSYTYSTMEYLQKVYPENEFYFIIGADSLCSFESWKYPERILKICHILVAYRDEVDTKKELSYYMENLKEKYQGNLSYLPAPKVEISSSMIREHIQQGVDIGDMVPLNVYNYIKTKGLYR
ncbi:nicotinate-nucleotide adenylyltransferase [Aequitasia blattaphilus]|uniref:Probable nicotinate-nucleotide adenylyltransferase n=1 Tax=Aequitasia blattaphilus TaxID=2949332 RepID=A0ABT1E5F0_9FIRM|nr:nicotinate-nucleotide adenylyltransferase [Aequitasia blattaphilus]MCP1101067.1 nicotinate-nucleotide adenylyltransferase [Aequitasia blattaphilus]MCR8613707.1 nicotinate-nucleotide adenylyltransferase [Aequitasia blattaphilus]